MMNVDSIAARIERLEADSPAVAASVDERTDDLERFIGQPLDAAFPTLKPPVTESDVWGLYVSVLDIDDLRSLVDGLGDEDEGPWPPGEGERYGAWLRDPNRRTEPWKRPELK